MRRKKIVKREQVNKEYTLDLEEMTLNQTKKKKYFLVKWSFLQERYAEKIAR